MSFIPPISSQGLPWFSSTPDEFPRVAPVSAYLEISEPEPTAFMAQSPLISAAFLFEYFLDHPAQAVTAILDGLFLCYVGYEMFIVWQTLTKPYGAVSILNEKRAEIAEWQTLGRKLQIYFKVLWRTPLLFNHNLMLNARGREALRHDTSAVGHAVSLAKDILQAMQESQQANYVDLVQAYRHGAGNVETLLLRSREKLRNTMGDIERGISRGKLLDSANHLVWDLVTPFFRRIKLALTRWDEDLHVALTASSAFSNDKLNVALQMEVAQLLVAEFYFMELRYLLTACHGVLRQITQLGHIPDKLPLLPDWIEGLSFAVVLRFVRGLVYLQDKKFWDGRVDLASNARDRLRATLLLKNFMSREEIDLFFQSCRQFGYVFPEYFRQTPTPLWMRHGMRPNDEWLLANEDRREMTRDLLELMEQVLQASAISAAVDGLGDRTAFWQSLKKKPEESLRAYQWRISVIHRHIMSHAATLLSTTSAESPVTPRARLNELFANREISRLALLIGGRKYAYDFLGESTAGKTDLGIVIRSDAMDEHDYRPRESHQLVLRIFDTRHHLRPVHRPEIVRAAKTILGEKTGIPTHQVNVSKISFSRMDLLTGQRQANGTTAQPALNLVTETFAQAKIILSPPAKSRWQNLRVRARLSYQNMRLKLGQLLRR